MLSVDSEIIGSFNKQRIAEILPEVVRQQASKVDFVFPAHKLSVGDEGKLVMAEVDSFTVGDPPQTFATWAEAENAARPGESIKVNKGGGALELTRNAERQLCERLGVPVTFVDRMREQGQATLAAYVLTERLQQPRRGEDYDVVDCPLCKGGGCLTCNQSGKTTNGNILQHGERFFVRTLDSRVRAILSDRYRAIDNVDIFYAAAERFETVKAEIWQMRISDDRFEMLAVSPGISGQVTTDRTFDPGDGWESRWANLGGDTQYAAVSVTNSETGRGGLNVRPAVLTRVCFNFNVWAKTFRAVHVGKVRDDDGLVVSSDVQAAEARLIWAKLRQSIDTVFDPKKFAEYIERLNNATQQAIEPKNIERVVENVAAKYELPDDRRAAILANVLRGGDFSRYGLAQAVTFQAHAEDIAGAADIAGQLQEIGGELINSSMREYAELIHA